LNITEEDLEQIISAFKDRNPHLWKKTNQDWILKNAVYK